MKIIISLPCIMVKNTTYNFLKVFFLLSTLAFSDIGQRLFLDMEETIEWIDLSSEEHKDSKKDKSKGEKENMEIDKFFTLPLLAISSPSYDNGRYTQLLTKSLTFYLEIPQPPPEQFC